jgi:hypothetical protein
VQQQQWHRLAARLCAKQRWRPRPRIRVDGRRGPRLGCACLGSVDRGGGCRRGGLGLCNRSAHTRQNQTPSIDQPTNPNTNTNTNINTKHKTQKTRQDLLLEHGYRGDDRPRRAAAHRTVPQPCRRARARGGSGRSSGGSAAGAAAAGGAMGAAAAAAAAAGGGRGACARARPDLYMHADWRDRGPDRGLGLAVHALSKS